MSPTEFGALLQLVTLVGAFVCTIWLHCRCACVGWSLERTYWKKALMWVPGLGPVLVARYGPRRLAAAALIAFIAYLLLLFVWG